MGLCGLKSANKFVISSNKSKQNKIVGNLHKSITIKLLEDRDNLSLKNDYLFKSEKFLNSMNSMYIQEFQIRQLWSFFKKIDINCTGYIQLHDIYDLICESPNSSITAPFLDRFFLLIEKESNDRATFEEFIPNLISYCLFSLYQIVDFIFNFIDKDHDGFISRNDIIKLMQLRRNEEDIFLVNNVWSIENYQNFKRSDKITKSEFITACGQLYFIPFPAVELQRKLRMYYIGNSFWNKLEKEIKNSYLDEIKFKQDIKIKTKIDQLKKKLVEDKIENFKNLKANLKKKVNIIYEEEIRLKRRISDTNFYLGKYLKEKEKKLKSKNLIEAKSFSLNINL